ncbi:hypothetical protein QQP08_019075 [Theobroma cacao]|nr:hypothetical protein QQP08_019075 [Theobroma cacao]
MAFRRGLKLKAGKLANILFWLPRALSNLTPVPDSQEVKTFILLRAKGLCRVLYRKGHEDDGTPC